MDRRQLLQSTLVLTGSALVSRTPGKIKYGDNGDVACDSDHRFSDDIALQRQLNLKSCRYSIAWPRIQPIGRGAANAEGLDYYKRLTSALPIGSVRRTLISADISGIGVIKRHELSHHAIGPAKTVLQQVFTATARAAHTSQPGSPHKAAATAPVPKSIADDRRVFVPAALRRVQLGQPVAATGRSPPC